MDLTNTFFSLICLLVFFTVMLVFIHLGNRLAVRQLEKYPNEQHPNTKIIEAAIFALMGLLIAFTFSNTHERFNNRRLLIIDEKNAIETAFLRLDLLPNTPRKILQEKFKRYIETRVALYKKLPNLNLATNDLDHSTLLQYEIWYLATEAVQSLKNGSATIVLLPAINQMIDIANSRTASLKIHPPIIILAILITLAVLSSLISGYRIGHKKIWRSLSVIIYAMVITITIFAIIDMEYPEIGLTQTNYHEDILAELSNTLQLDHT